MSESITDRIDAITKIPPEYLVPAPPAPRSVKIELTQRCNYRCLRGDTLVDTIYGRIAIKELAENFETVPVLTYRDGEIFFADAINIRKYGENEKMVRVHFDDDTHIDCTPDHKFLQFSALNKGPGVREWAVEAQDLKPGVSVRAYRENSQGAGYINICWGRQFSRKRSRLVMDYLMQRKLERAEMVHHRDHNVTNDHPDNLEYVASAKEHAARHPENAERMRTANPTLNMTQEWRDNCGRAQRGKTRSLEQRIRYRESKLGAKNPNFTEGRTAGSHRSRIAEVNHKITHVEHLAETDDVYCLEVPSTGWFFANQVLVKNCAFCALQFRENSNTDMDWDLFKRITTEMREAGVVEIAPFYIGESFTTPKLLVKAIKWLKDDLQTPYVFLTTNGSLVTPGIVEEVMAAGLNSLKFSITSSDEDEFEKIIQVNKRMFYKALDNIKTAREIRDRGGYQTRLYASSIKYDGLQQDKMQALLDARVLPYVDQHYWLPLYTFGAMTNHTTEAMDYKPTPGNMGRLGALRDPLPCWCVFTEGHVCADGMLSACGFDATSIYTIANLNEVSFMAGWHSASFQELRTAHINKDVSKTVCSDCALYK
jgi:MoaA/NifB/PqqE/SkfB family radical SAM enzyme